MGAVFRLSPFRLSTFRRCRRLYKYRYVERLPSSPNPHETMGSHVHAALRTLMTRPVAERTPARAADLLRVQWATNRAGFRGLAEEARWRSRALEQVERFLDMPESKGQPAALERTLEAPLGERVRLFGRIDRIDEAPDGSLRIIDYKTGRPPDDPDPEQLHIYAMMLSRTDERPVSLASYLYLEDGTRWALEPGDDTLRNVEAGVLEAAEAMAREREYVPNVGSHCLLCDFRPICPKRDEIARRLATNVVHTDIEQ